MKVILFSFIVAIHAAPAGLRAAEVYYVNPETGKDANAGTQELPFATVQHAVDLAKPGAVIHLLPKDAIYRQEFEIKDKQDLTINGNGVTLSGADPLPADGWEDVAEGLHRRRVKRSFEDRYLLIVAGKAQRMGRSPSARANFPAPEALTDGQFACVPIDDAQAWLYVRGPIDKLEWSVRMTGISTWNVDRNIVIRNLHTRHALNDGFNIHGDCRSLLCSNISGYENFDEGFSAHDTSEVRVEHGLFYGNDNAVADIQESKTVYIDCTFRDSVTVEVYFEGGQHQLMNCLIASAGKAALSVAPGDLKGKATPVQLAIESCTIQSADSKTRPINVRKTDQVTIAHSVLRGVKFEIEQSKITATDSQLDGAPLKLE